MKNLLFFFFFSSRRRHTRWNCDWSSDVCSSDLEADDPGTASLRRYLHEAAAEFPIRRDQRLFRLAVDRVFTLPGHGTVATGTVFSGQIAVGDTINIMPAGTSVRVRGLHVQNRPAHHGRAGQRCAINLAGVE